MGKKYVYTEKVTSTTFTIPIFQAHFTIHLNTKILDW